MTKLLERAITELRDLPENRQDEAAQILLQFLQQGREPYSLTDGERAEVCAGLHEAKRGEFASDEDVEAVMKRHGL